MSNSGQPNLAHIAQKILEDALHNIIHDIVIHRHREHRLLLASLNSSTRLPHCDTCKLPRLLEPPLAPKVRGTTSEPPANTTYCDRKPWARRPGHDIYGNPFLKSDVTGRPLTKKEREAAKNKKDDGTPASEDANAEGNGPPSPSQDGEGGGNTGKLEKGEKKASKIDEKLKKGEYVPWHTCPSCKRSLLITRFAKHLEQCMGLSGRAASRNALAKMNGTPSGSRGGTPNPGNDGKDKDDDDDDVSLKGSGGVRKKLLKKGLKDKVRKEKSFSSEINKKLPKNLGSKKPPNSQSTALRSSPAPSTAGDGKREREDGDDDGDDDEVHVKKRQKLQRVESTVSVISQSTAAPDMERGESNDGNSFVGDGSFVDD